MGECGRTGQGTGRGKGIRAEAQEADGSEEWRSCRTQGVNITATEGGSEQTRAGGGNEAGRGMAVSVSSCRGYTLWIAALKLLHVFGLASVSLVMENVPQDEPSV